jgi:hypothetical protein
MSDKEYLEIILKGWIEDRGGFLDNYFYREWKKAESNHYSLEEFFLGLIRLQKALTDNIDQKYFERLNEVYIMQSIYEKEGRDIKELEGQVPEKKNYSINLWHITGDNKYLGFTLWQSDIDYIGGQIANAFERANKEKNAVNEPEKKEEMKQRYHLNYIKRAVEDLFTKQIEKRRDTESDSFLPSEGGINVKYIDIPIDTRNPERLNEIANERLREFLKESDNTKELFIEIETEKAKEYQTYFPEYKTNKEQKGYYFKLERWIECLKELSESKKAGENNNNENRKKTGLEYKTLKEIFISSEAFKIVMDKLIEEELIDKTSFEWTNNSSGYKSKIAALLYHLYHNKYFKCIELPKPEQIIVLAKNGFNVDITVRTIQDKKVHALRKEFPFIKQFVQQA